MDPERHHDPAQLSGNGRAEHAVSCTGIPARAVVAQGQRGVFQEGIGPPIQREDGEAIRVVRADRNDGRFTGGRQHGFVANVGQSRRSVVHGPRIARAGRSAAFRHVQSPGGFEPVAPDAEQYFRPARQPAHPGPERDGVTGGQRTLETEPDPVGARVEIVAGANVQRTGAAVPLGGFQAGTDVRSLRGEAGRGAFEVAIGDSVGSCRSNHFHVVDQAFSFAQ